jgi:cytochrome P450
MQFDPFGPEVRRDPYSYYEELRREHPIHRLDIGFWLISRYEDVQFVLKSPHLFSSTGMAGAGGLQAGQTRSIITIDPPDHGHLRSLVSRAFTPKMIANLEPRIRELTRGLLSGLRHGAEFDVIDGLALPLPVRVIAEMLGVEPQRQDDFKRWSDIMVGRMMRPSASAEQVAYEEAEMRAFEDYFRWAIEDRRKNPGDDLVSALVQAEEQHQRLTADEVFAFAGLLLVAGNETTTNLIGNMVLALLRHPGQLDRLRDSPSRIPQAIEEALRYDSPVQMLFRIAREDVPLGDKVIPTGAMVWPILGSANHDETRYPNPERFDITRDASGHVAFGSGIHFCLGAPLARLEARIAMEELVPHLAGARLAERPHDYIDAFFLRGLKHLPVHIAEHELGLAPAPAGLRSQWTHAAHAFRDAIKASYLRLARRTQGVRL